MGIVLCLFYRGKRGWETVFASDRFFRYAKGVGNHSFVFVHSFYNCTGKMDGWIVLPFAGGLAYPHNIVEGSLTFVAFCPLYDGIWTLSLRNRLAGIPFGSMAKKRDIRIRYFYRCDLGCLAFADVFYPGILSKRSIATGVSPGFLFFRFYRGAGHPDRCFREKKRRDPAGHMLSFYDQFLRGDDASQHHRGYDQHTASDGGRRFDASTIFMQKTFHLKIINKSKTIKRADIFRLFYFTGISIM